MKSPTFLANARGEFADRFAQRRVGEYDGGGLGEGDLVFHQEGEEGKEFGSVAEIKRNTENQVVFVEVDTEIASSVAFDFLFGQRSQRLSETPVGDALGFEFFFALPDPGGLYRRVDRVGDVVGKTGGVLGLVVLGV